MTYSMSAHFPTVNYLHRIRYAHTYSLSLYYTALLFFNDYYRQNYVNYVRCIGNEIESYHIRTPFMEHLF